MRDGEDDVPMRAVEQSDLLLFQPAFVLQPVTLRAAAVAAGVIPDSVDVPVLATPDMTAEFGGATVDKGLRGLVVV